VLLPLALALGPEQRQLAAHCFVALVQVLVWRPPADSNLKMLPTRH
jgi:hypothetical protein